jgi:hypothetical protein
MPKNGQIQLIKEALLKIIRAKHADRRHLRNPFKYLAGGGDPDLCLSRPVALYLKPIADSEDVRRTALGSARPPRAFSAADPLKLVREIR